MTEILNGVGYGNILIDGSSVIATSSEALMGLSEHLSDMLMLMANDMSQILRIPPDKILFDYTEELGADLMNESFHAAIKKQYEKEGKEYERPETLTRSVINRFVDSDKTNI